MTKPRIAFIGAGNMAASLIGGLIADGYPSDALWVSCPTQSHLDAMTERYQIHATLDNSIAAAKADIIVFAVKPQVLQAVALELASIVSDKKPLVVSVVAGVREKLIANWLGGDVAIVRCMPNTPALVSASATALYANAHVSEVQRERAESILQAVGLTLWLDDESKLDVVTALSGSGPAYFFLLMEALQEAGTQLGLSEEEARLLVLQTGLGSTRMAMESQHQLSDLRQRVTSPGGTTERALEALASHHFKDVILDAIQVASLRATELSDMYEDED